MADVRETQNVIEVVTDISAPIRETQNVIEILSPIPVNTRQSQNILEILADVTVETRQSQNILELLFINVPPPDISGIYFINPDKSGNYDSYYIADRKIPNPTIKTALFGE